MESAVTTCAALVLKARFPAAAEGNALLALQGGTASLPAALFASLALPASIKREQA